jgi:hypothetical protein
LASNRRSAWSSRSARSTGVDQRQHAGLCNAHHRPRQDRGVTARCGPRCSLPEGWRIIYPIFDLASLPTLSVAVRRLHDRGPAAQNSCAPFDVVACDVDRRASLPSRNELLGPANPGGNRGARGRAADAGRRFRTTWATLPQSAPA